MATNRYDAAIASFYATPFQLRKKVAELISGQGEDGTERRNSGTVSFSGTGAQTAFVIPHGLSVAPVRAHVSALSLAAAGARYITIDATNITVTFVTAPTSGTNNVSFVWDASISI